MLRQIGRTLRLAGELGASTMLQSELENETHGAYELPRDRTGASPPPRIDAPKRTRVGLALLLEDRNSVCSSLSLTTLRMYQAAREFEDYVFVGQGAREEEEESDHDDDEAGLLASPRRLRVGFWPTQWLRGLEDEFIGYIAVGIFSCLMVGVVVGGRKVWRSCKR
jgi:hypothetical protein